MNQQLQQRESDVSAALELESIKNQLAGLLNNNPRKMEAFKSRMLKMSTTFMLKECTPVSLIAAGLQAETLNLPLEAGQGYIVKYGAEAQLDVGYKGWQLLAKRSGLSVLGDPVYTCDQFNQSGFGFDAEMSLEPNHSERKSADDKWVLDNIVGVIVSVREDESGLVQTRFIPKDMLMKIVGMSPSTKTDNAKKFSPHENWREQMLIAKAIKQVLSKTAIDISKASELNEAIQIVNTTESAAQKAAPPPRMPEYPHENFETNWPKWVELVETGKKKAVVIVSQLSNGYTLTVEQTEKMMTLKNHEPIEGDVVDGEVSNDDTQQPEQEVA